jgi:hypothetical protein
MIYAATRTRESLEAGDAVSPSRTPGCQGHTSSIVGRLEQVWAELPPRGPRAGGDAGPRSRKRF